ncbi:MAG: WD40 repeat domain-containing protein, partial [Planctomycetes bacterium]|nr:WD40 repeat domain-containing protein [Planctomycetota bacterium]
MVRSLSASSGARLRSFVLSLCAAMNAAPAQSPFECDLFVTEESPSRVWTHHGITGAPTGPAFASESTPRFFMAIHHGTLAQPVLVGTFGNGVFEYQRNTGAYIKTYNASNDWQWAALFAANGDVLIGSQNLDEIRRYDPVTGLLIGSFATGVVEPADMIFGPNGNLFVCSYEPTIGGVYELNGTTGAFVALHAAGVVKRANDLVFLPDGRRIVISSHPSS